MREGRLKYDKAYARNQYLANVAVNSASLIFRQATLNQQCLLRSPTLLSALSGIGANLSASLSSGSLGLGFAAFSQTLGHTLEFVRKAKLNGHIQQLGQSEFTSAYQCVLESLSNQWCEAREVYDLIDLKMQSLSPYENADTAQDDDLFARIVKTLNRDLPILNNWLYEVAAFSPSETSTLADQRVIFLIRELKIKRWEIESIRKLGLARKKLPPSTATQEEQAKLF